MNNQITIYVYVWFSKKTRRYFHRFSIVFRKPGLSYKSPVLTGSGEYALDGAVDYLIANHHITALPRSTAEMLDEYQIAYRVTYLEKKGYL